jgi:hypothetical protein
MLGSLAHAEAVIIFTYTVFIILPLLSEWFADAEILANKKVPGLNGVGCTIDRRSDNRMRLWRGDSATRPSDVISQADAFLRAATK